MPSMFRSIFIGGDIKYSFIYQSKYNEGQKAKE